MRIWNVDPRLMCRKHLLGEHVELHMLVGALNARKNLAGFYDTGLVDTRLIIPRHEALVEEMQRRGFKHASSLVPFTDPQQGTVDVDASYRELQRRCPGCATRMEPA